MSFHVPSFPLLCHIYGGQGLGPPLPKAVTQANVRCQLQMPRGERFLQTTSQGTVVIMRVLLPKGTDVRAQTIDNPNPDALEIPAGTGRFYKVLAVEDVARGFPNEARAAIIAPNPQLHGWWPFPLP